jgi:hypothetical protein
MGSKPKLQQGISHFLIVISCVQAHVLRILFRLFWTLDPDVFYRFAHQFHIMAIRSLHRQANGHTMPLGQSTSFGALLAPVCRISARIFPSRRHLGR